MSSKTSESEPSPSAEVSLSDVLQSNPELSPSVPRVLDYLYHDARRIGSFLAQLHDLGLIQEIKQTDSAGQSENSKTNVSGGIRVLAHGEAAHEQSVGADEKETSERKYDPFWKSAGAILDIVEEQNLVQRDIWHSRLGQIVRMSGSLIVFNVAPLKQVLANEKLKSLVQKSFTDGLPLGANPDEAHVTLEMISILPSSTQAHFVGENFNAWAVLDEQSLVTSANDIMLKHGSLVRGRFEMLGIVDAFPEPNKSVDEDGSSAPSLDEIVQKNAFAPVAYMASVLAPVARNMMGRPDHFFGVTPLLIFREVSG